MRLVRSLAKRRMQAVLPHVQRPSARCRLRIQQARPPLRERRRCRRPSVARRRRRSFATPRRLQWESASFDTDHHHRGAQSHSKPRGGAERVPARAPARAAAWSITMLTPRTSRIWHWLRAPWDADQRERGMQPGEVYGFTSAQLARALHARRLHAVVAASGSCSASTGSTSSAWPRGAPEAVLNRAPGPRQTCLNRPSGSKPCPLPAA